FSHQDSPRLGETKTFEAASNASARAPAVVPHASAAAQRPTGLQSPIAAKLGSKIAFADCENRLARPCLPFPALVTVPRKAGSLVAPQNSFAIIQGWHNNSMRLSCRL